MKNDLKGRIEVARGLKKADLVLKGGQVVNVFSGEVYRADVAVYRGVIAGLGEYEGKRVIDVSSKYILPGFIDSHVHLESSMLTPAEFARAALPHGTTSIVADPHEIANVLGSAGIRYLLKATEGLPLDFYFMLPSCVPATPLETSGAHLRSADLKPFLTHDRVLGLAEMMDYPGVLGGETDVMRKLRTFRNTVIDGHAPGLSGKELSAYVGAGIISDHECVSAAEALEKVRLGMMIFIREGSSAKNLEALLPAVTQANARFFAFATDDFEPDDLKNGGIDLLVKKAIHLGLDPVTAIQMATINPASHFGLKRTGAVLPGYAADMIIIDNLRKLSVEMVFKAGSPMASNNRLTTPIRSQRPTMSNSVRVRSLKKAHLRIPAKTNKVRIIELVPRQIATRQRILRAPTRNGYVVSDTEQDILKLVVVERHRKSGRRGLGLVKGLGLRSGAIASTVAHDSHNIIAVGVTDDDILHALSEIKKIHGGLVVVQGGTVMAELPLPVAGLISDRGLDYVVKKLREIEGAVKGLGAAVPHPFGILSFLALPVIPELKLTDRGLVEVKSMSLVDLFV